MTEPGLETYRRLLVSLVDRKVVGLEDEILVQFAGELDERVFSEAGLQNCTHTNVNPPSASSRLTTARSADAHRMPLPDGSFDHVFAHAGLHHCSRPHEALHEMYRIARKTVVFVENQDSYLMRLAQRAGIVGHFEFEAVVDGAYASGGVDGTGVPNYVYRWTERELRKTVSTFDPGRCVPVEVYREWNMDANRVSTRRLKEKIGIRSDRIASWVIRSIMVALHVLAKSQGNIFAAVIRKDASSSRSWIDPDTGLLVRAPSQ